MKGILLFSGECFRMGDQGSKDRGSDAAYPQQMEAAYSHIRLIESLEQKGYDMSVYISSYTTKFDEEFKNVYAKYLLGCDFHADLISQHFLIHNAIQTIENIEQYDFLLLLRIDLYLKDHFISIMNPTWDKVLFPSICHKPHHTTGSSVPFPRVNDMMIFIPKKYFYCIPFIIYRGIWIGGHDQWMDFIVHGLTTEDMDMMIDTFHDSNSSIDWNPIYYVVNRPQSMATYNDSSMKFDKYNFV